MTLFTVSLFLLNACGEAPPRPGAQVVAPEPPAPAAPGDPEAGALAPATATDAGARVGAPLPGRLPARHPG